MSGMTDEEMAELTERLSGVPAASVLRAVAVEYETRRQRRKHHEREI